MATDGKLVKLRERMLLLNSKTIEDYPWLYQFLEENPNIKESELATLPPDTQNFFNNMFKLILKQASEEWTSRDGFPVDVLDGDERIPCELCHTPIKYICYITNEVNGKELVVGSECVTHFGMDLGKPPAQLFKERIRTKRLEKLNTEFPGIGKIINSWNQTLEEYAILIPEKLEKPYLELGSHTSNLYQNYLDGKEAESDQQEIFDTFKGFLRDREKSLVNIENYVKDNISKKFIPTKDIVIWLTREGRREAIEWLKEDGLITWRTAHRIEEPTFMNLLVPEFNSAIKTFEVKIEKVDLDFRGKRGYVIQPLQTNEYKLFCKHSDLVINYGGLIFGQELVSPFSIGSLFNIGVTYDEKSIDIVVSNLSRICKGSGIGFKEHDIEFNEIVIFENSSGKYVILKLKDFAEQFKKLAFGLDEQNSEKVVSYINSLPNRRYSSEELKDLKSIRSQF